MTQKELKKIKEDLKEYIEDYPELNNTKLAEKYLVENEDVPLSVRSIRQYVSLVKAANEGIEDDAEVTEDEPIKSNEPEIISDAGIHITYAGDTHIFSRRDLDLIYCAYSRKGLNLTSQVLQDILSIEPERFRAAVKYGLNKESLPYSDVSAEVIDADQLYNELDENISILLDKLHEHDGTVVAPLVKKYKKAVVKQGVLDLKLRSIVAELKEQLPKLKIGDPGRPDNIDTLYTAMQHMHVFIPDMHIGLYQDNYNLKVVGDQLQYISDLLYGANNIHVHFLGDIIHSVTGLNHKTSWKNMEPGIHGAAAIIEPYKLLLDFLNNIPGLISVDFVGGNHDRLSSDKNEENTGEAERLVAFMLEETITNEYIKFSFHPGLIIDDLDPNLTIITMHGDYPVDKASGQSIAWEYGNNNKFNYIVTAHMHSRKQNPKEDGLKFRKVQMPAFCPSDDYAKTVAHPSLPGFQIVYADANGLPIVTDYPLYYER